MTDKQIKALADGTMASVGMVQGMFKRFLEENKGDAEIALRLTQITWDGLMISARCNSEDDTRGLM